MSGSCRLSHKKPEAERTTSTPGHRRPVADIGHFTWMTRGLQLLSRILYIYTVCVCIYIYTCTYGPTVWVYVVHNVCVCVYMYMYKYVYIYI